MFLFLVWMDHDSKMRQSTLGAMARLQGKEIRGEHEFCTVRDSFADRSFVTTRAIQKVRYNYKAVMA